MVRTLLQGLVCVGLASSPVAGSEAIPACAPVVVLVDSPQDEWPEQQPGRRRATPLPKQKNATRAAAPTVRGERTRQGSLADPTKPDAAMARVLRKGDEQKAPPPPPLPALQLKGLVVSAKGASALVGVGNRLVRLSRGATLAIGGHVLDVVSIDATGVRVRSQTVGVEVSVR